MPAVPAGYARISTYVRGQFRLLNGPDDHALAQLTTLPAGPGREEFMAASTLPEAVNGFLCQLDMKMDALLAGMWHSALDQDFPHRMEILSLSASSLEFTATQPLALGNWLEIIIHFKQMGMFTAAGIGNITAQGTQKDGAPVFAFAFTRILEEEREKIIKHVFQEERRLLRKTRLDIE
jgi:hypothetical protein